MPEPIFAAMHVAIHRYYASHGYRPDEIRCGSGLLEALELEIDAGKQFKLKGRPESFAGVKMVEDRLVAPMTAYCWPVRPKHVPVSVWMIPVA